MKYIRPLLSIAVLTGTLASTALPTLAQAILSKTRLEGTDYCHLRFPAIEEETLSWDRPVLKSTSTTDLIDYYGPCDHDPLGKDEIARQRDEFHRRSRENGTN